MVFKKTRFFVQNRGENSKKVSHEKIEILLVSEKYFKPLILKLFLFHRIGYFETIFRWIRYRFFAIAIPLEKLFPQVDVAFLPYL